MMIKVLFVCYGNICRSPLAEFVFKDMVEREGLSDVIDVASCATSGEHIGDPVDPRSRAELAKHGIDGSGKVGRRIRPDDFSEYDYVLGMDRRNLQYLRNMCDDDECHVGLLLDYAGGGEVADPWYTGDFGRAYRDVERGCRGLMDELKERIR